MKQDCHVFSLVYSMMINGSNCENRYMMYAMVQGWGLNLHSLPGMFQDIAQITN